VYTDLQSAA